MLGISLRRYEIEPPDEGPILTPPPNTPWGRSSCPAVLGLGFHRGLDTHQAPQQGGRQGRRFPQFLMLQRPMKSVDTNTDIHTRYGLLILTALPLGKSSI